MPKNDLNKNLKKDYKSKISAIKLNSLNSWCLGIIFTFFTGLILCSFLLGKILSALLEKPLSVSEMITVITSIFISS